MKVLDCPQCQSRVEIPDLPSPQRAEIAHLRFSDRTVEAYQQLSRLADLDLRLAKRLVIHLPHQAGQCHRCQAQLTQGEAVQCGKCGSVNVQWADRGGEAA